MKLYKYGMRLRPCGPGCQPYQLKGFEEDETGKYHNIIYYSRELADEEIVDYELDFLGVVE